MPTGNLCQELLKQYQSSQARAAHGQNGGGGANGQKRSQINSLVDDEYLVAKKRRVIKFVRFWMLINREHFFQQQQIYTFVMVSFGWGARLAGKHTYLHTSWHKRPRDQSPGAASDGSRGGHDGDRNAKLDR